MKAFFREFLVTLILAVVIFFLLQITIGHSVVTSASMEPTLEIGHHLLVNKVVYKFHEPERGDIITFYPPDRPKAVYIKRVIGLPGDTVEVKAGVVYVNDSPLDEPYIKESPSYTFHRQKIPGDNYFVLGDNRNNSSDSHNGWTVKREDIIGKAWLSIWPPTEWGLVATSQLYE